MKKKVFFIFVLILFSLELISRITYKETYYDKIIKILTQDPKLLWKTKTNLNTIFESVVLKTNSFGFRNDEISLKTKKRIIIMGASPSFGWGVAEEKTYPYLISKKLKGYEVINASVIGYSSYQGRILFETVIKDMSPDIIIFAYGVNDPDRYRFFRNEDKSDKDLKPLKSYDLYFSEILRKSYFLKKLYLFLADNGILKPEIHFRRRVEPSDYIENIKYFKDECHNKGIKLILLTSPFLIPPNYEKYSKCLEKEIKKCVQNETGGNYDFKKIQEAQLSQIYKDITEYNSDLLDYAKKEKISNIDLFKIFESRKDLFLKPDKDMVHFSEKGHKKIAEIIIKEITKK
ncbi:MAG TPA: GDSL-type esterase/lipase family protein [Elusimicrobiales bacterium]|nr:GDSL-type esterase/lipase family protein [Elusimicrobiales bacterium]HOL62631.1 GDSL-type esterase/lipase family protein [Elusimicrobiales bacterium]HPO95402.1 GDSL-type esterase/lipase family protein [Elusimicrobiales bacterium]